MLFAVACGSEPAKPEVTSTTAAPPRPPAASSSAAKVEAKVDWCGGVACKTYDDAKAAANLLSANDPDTLRRGFEMLIEKVFEAMGLDVEPPKKRSP